MTRESIARQGTIQPRGGVRVAHAEPENQTEVVLG